MSRTIVLGLACCFLFAGSKPSAPLPPPNTEGSDWPGWRGADRSGLQSESMLTSWPEGSPRQLWVFDDAGLGYSGPAVVDGVLFTMGARGRGEYMIAIDANTGQERWATKMGKRFKNNWGNGPRGTPTVAGGKVYGLGAYGDLICANAADGTELWSASMTKMGGKIPGWGYSESVLVDEGRVICTPGGSDGTLAALDANTGAILWRSTDFVEKAHYSSPIVIDHQGQRQYVQLTEKKLAGVAADTGATIWTAKWNGKTAVIPTPIFHDGHIFVSSGYGVGCARFEIATGAVRPTWSNKVMKNHHGGVILFQDHLFGYSDQRGWTCMEWATGEPVWNDESIGKGAIAIAGGMLVLVQESDGLIVLADASSEGWKERGRFALAPQSSDRPEAGRVWTHPVILNGKLYLRDQQYIHCYDVSE